MSRDIQVEVVYGLSDRQTLLALTVPEGTTAEQAVERSGICTQYPDINPQTARMGLFGKLIGARQVLRDHDRVEIYRSLLADPKEVRRRRASKNRETGTDGNAG